MISVIHKSGSSFKGLAAYLLHDKDQANTDDRVAWTHTHNLATDDPELAWRIQVATAMQQAELKQEAGVPNTGRKSHNHVMHYSLSWHPDERKELSRADMLQAALASMTYIGTYEGEVIGKGMKAKRTHYADQHQAVIVCHDEGENTPPHVHIMLNRVHPEHGVMLPTTMEKNRLSKWALEYRQAQGKEGLCPQRVKNWAKKAEGIAVNNPRKPRNVYEQEQAANDSDPGSRKKALLDLLRRKATELKIKDEAMKRQQAEAMAKLQEQHLMNEKLERARAQEESRQGKAQVKEAFAVKIDGMTDRQASEMAEFEEAKKTASGRVRNTWAALKTKQWMTEIRTQPLHATTHAFKLAFSSGMQQRDIQAHHDKEQQRLKTQRQQQERDAARLARTQGEARLDERRQLYERDRSDMLLKQEMDKAKMNAQWHQLRQDQQAAAIEDDRARKAALLRDQVENQAGQQEKEKSRRDAVKQQQQAEQSQVSPPVPDPPDPPVPPGSPEISETPVIPDGPAPPPGGTAVEKDVANDNAPAVEKTPLAPEYNQAASPPPAYDPPPDGGDDRARKMQDFAQQQEQQSTELGNDRGKGQGNDQGQDMT